MQHPLWYKFLALNSPAFCSYGFHRYSRSQGPGFCSAVLFTPLSKPARGLVVFLHGAGNDFLFPNLSLFRRLLLEGYIVFSFNGDGHGREDSTLLHPERFTSSVADALSHAQHFAPHLPLFLVGHSLGGALIFNYLAQESLKKIAKAVVISTPLTVTGIEIAFIKEGKSLLCPDLYAQLFLYGFYGLIPSFGVFKRRDFPVRFDPAILSQKHHSIFAISRWLYSHLELETKLPLIQTPVLLAYGSWDALAPLSHGQQISSLLPSSQLLSVSHGTHFTTLFSPKTENTLVEWLQ